MRSALFFLVFAAGLFACNPKAQVQKSNQNSLSQQLVMSVLWYQTSAEMVASYLQAYNYGKIMLDSKLDTLVLKKPGAIVLDIDETVLDNSAYEVFLIKNNQQYASDTWKDWTDKVQAEALPGALDFINYAKSRGVQVFYISNRKENELTTTIENLKKHGFPNAEEKFVLLKSETSDKTERRDKVESAYQVLVFLGDNLGDYSEEYANRGEDFGKNLVMMNKKELLSNFVILPNPMYGEWESAIYKNDFSISDEEKLNRRINALRD